MLHDNQTKTPEIQEDSNGASAIPDTCADIDLGAVNLQRVRKFSLIMAWINFFCLLGSSYSFFASRSGPTLVVKKIMVFHSVAAVVYLTLYLIPFKKLGHGRLPFNSDRISVWMFSLLSILFFIFLSLISNYHEGAGFIALLIVCGLILAFHRSLLDSLFTLFASLVAYWMALNNIDTGQGLSTQFINALVFSGVVFGISRHYYQSKTTDREDRNEKRLQDEIKQLKSIEKTLLSINRNLLQGVFRIDQQGHLVYVNEFLVRLFGYQSSESMTSDWNLNRIISARDVRQIRTDIETKGYVRDREIRYVRSDGSVFWGLISCTSCCDDENIYYDGIIIDNTERKNNERILENLSLVASKTDNAVFIIDREEKIEWVNEGFTRMTGYQFQEALGKKPGILFQGEHTDPAAIRLLGERISRGEGFSGELLNYRKDGSELWVHFTLNPILNQRKEIIKYVAVESDITDRKRVEQELIKAKEQAEASMKAKDQFLSMVSHELRTPLNAVIGMTHLLLQEEPREDQLQQLKTINTSGQYLLALINDILDFSKIEAGKIAIDPINFNFHQLINDLEQTFFYNAQEKNIKFFIEIDPAIPRALIGDPVRLNQVLVNLVGNSIKFTDVGFVKLDVSALSDDDGVFHLKFTITDTGIGIPEDKLAAIFEKFEQVEGPNKRGGTGLGLAITKNLIDLMGGMIHVESELGKGSEFTFDLYFSTGEEEELEESASAAHNIIDNLDQLQVLLVEDNKINQLVAAKFLKQWKIQFDIADNGKQAIGLAQSKRYDIILMDLQMPELDGESAAIEIRNNEGYSHVPIIALTAASLESKERVYKAGMNDFLIKPFNPVELYNKLKKYADGIPTPMIKQENLEGLDISGMQKISDGDTQFLLELLRLCVEQFKSLPVQLKEALKDNNLIEARKIIHKINPSIKMLQFYQLEKTTMEFQKLLKKEEESGEIERKANELIEIIGRIETLLMDKAAELNRKLAV